MILREWKGDLVNDLGVFYLVDFRRKLRGSTWSSRTSKNIVNIVKY